MSRAETKAMITGTIRRAVASVAVLAAAALAATPAAAAGVTVALAPQQQVAPGTEFDVYIQVTQAGAAFNGFEAVVAYDTTALTFVPLSPVSLQEGAYMTGACGSTFHVFAAHAGLDSITDVLLCKDVSLPGPGTLYRLHFRASTTVQRTIVSFLQTPVFYNAGLYVTPVQAMDVKIGIGMPPDVGVDPPGLPGRLSVRPAPDPARGSLLFRIDVDREGPATLRVVAVQGRVVRRLEPGRLEAGRHTLPWDGRDEAGARLPPGTYLARLEVAGRVAWSRLTLLR